MGHIYIVIVVFDKKNSEIEGRDPLFGFIVTIIRKRFDHALGFVYIYEVNRFPAFDKRCLENVWFI